MEDMQNYDGLVFDGEHYPVLMGFAAIQQFGALQKEILRSPGQSCNGLVIRKEWLPLLSVFETNAGLFPPASCSSNHSKMASKSCSAWAEYSTRKAMFPA